MSTPCVLLGTSHLSIISVFADQKKKKLAVSLLGIILILPIFYYYYFCLSDRGGNSVFL